MNRNLARTATLTVLLVGVVCCAAPARADDAAALYKAKCAGCHAPDGSGSTPAGKALKVSDLRADDTQKKTDAELIDVTAKGKDKMPAFKDKLTADQIKQLVAYIRELAKKK
jgi:mono/diheme cytochrome c family protein